MFYVENLTYKGGSNFQSDLILQKKCYTKIKTGINYISMAYPNVQGGPKKVYDVI